MARLLFIGDIVGRPGREVVEKLVPALRAELSLDFVIANGENAAAGSGITTRLAHELLSAGVDAITLGDHVWDQRGFELDIGGSERICRPANLPRAQPGRDHLILTAPGGLRLGVFTVLGRVFVDTPSECPFLTAERILGSLEGVDAVLAEIHAEATAEKIAYGYALDGRVTAVLGTHTHVATADAALLPAGTAYQTDVGMTGPHRSVLGREIQPVLAKFRDGMPRRLEVAEGDPRLSGTVVDFAPGSRTATSIQWIQRSIS